MGAFGDSGDDVEIKVILDAVQAIEQVEKIEAKIKKLEESGEGASEKTLLLKEALDKLKNSSQDAGGGFSDLQKKIITANEAMELGEKLGKLFVEALKAVPNLLINLADAGATLGDLEAGFEGLGGASKSIDDASARINGILPNIDLLRLANKAMVAGVPEINKNFADIVEYGKRMGDTLGKGATEGVENLTDALIRGNPVALKNLGIIIDSEKAFADYAKRMGITGRELSDLEKNIAKTSQALELMRDELGKMPEATGDVQDGIEGIQAKFKDFVGETGKAINNNQDLTDALKDLGDELGKIDIKEFADDVATLASMFVRAATSTVQFIENLRKAWKEAGNASKSVEDNTKALEANRRKQLELELVMEEQKQAHEQELKLLKKQADERDKETKAIEANKKAREENEKAQKQAADTADKALKGLQKEIRDFARSDDLAGMQNALTEAFKIGDTGAIQRIGNDIQAAVYNGIYEGHEQAGGTFDDKNLEAIRERAQQETGEYIKEAEEEAKKNKWSLFDTILGGAFSDQSIERARQQMESVASSIETSIADAISIGLEGGFNSEVISGLTASLGQAIGTAYGGPIGGAFGGFYGQKLGESASKIGDSTQDTISGTAETLSMILPFFAPLILGVGKLVSAVVGGSLSQDEQALKGLDSWIEQKLATAQESGTGTSLNLGNLETGSFIGNGNWSEDFWASFDERAVGSFSALGEGITQIAGITEDVGGQLGYILANNLNGNLDKARMLLIELGIGAEDLTEAFLQMGLKGEESWHTIEVWMQRIPELTGEGLVGIGDLDGAMGQFISSAGRGQESLISLRNIAIEGIESGATSLADLRTKLEASGKYTVEQLDAFFGALDRRGITTLDGLRDSSDRLLGGVTADAESLGFAWEENVSAGMQDSIEDVKELKKVINELPDEVEKNIVLKVRTEYSGDDAKALYSDLSAGVAR